MTMMIVKVACSRNVQYEGIRVCFYYTLTWKYILLLCLCGHGMLELAL